ncbi:Uncharacterized protein FWK35_00005272 [Aphis craccivora]|uniref:Transposable element P transposase-like GTP-binding insertion domain-containing protein n=1 Tax=Aphis craccivora TaxID=307492 RepID=A0A6G0YIZ1_APHCR|nr:Uncharacterized protein FWK35_00005272 [Aphis craccivora]
MEKKLELAQCCALLYLVRNTGAPNIANPKCQNFEDGLRNIIVEQKYKNAILLQGAISSIKCENIIQGLDTNDDLAIPLDKSEMKLIYTNKRSTASTYVLPVHNESKRICLDSNNIDAHKVSDDFNKILYDMNSILVPFNWSRILPANKKMVIFSKVFVNKDVELTYFERCVSVHKDMTIECRYLNKIINNYSILNQSNTRELNNIQNMIYNFDFANMCSGVKIPEEDRKKKSRSPRLKRIHSQVTPSKKLKLKILRNRNKLKTESLEHDTIVKKLIENNTPPNHLFRKKGPKGNRYAEDWIMLCMLLHIRFPSGYSFMRENKLLPLPCISVPQNFRQSFETIEFLFENACSPSNPIFNKSMADGLRFYQKHKVPGLEHSDATINFTLIMNNMFDALNA